MLSKAEIFVQYFGGNVVVMIGFWMKVFDALFDHGANSAKTYFRAEP